MPLSPLSPVRNSRDVGEVKRSPFTGLFTVLFVEISNSMDWTASLVMTRLDVY